MQFKSPMKITWIVAVILGLIGTLPIMGVKLPSPLGGANSVYFLIAAWVLLALATVIKGL